MLSWIIWTLRSIGNLDRARDKSTTNQGTEWTGSACHDDNNLRQSRPRGTVSGGGEGRHTCTYTHRSRLSARAGERRVLYTTIQIVSPTQRSLALPDRSTIASANR